MGHQVGPYRHLFYVLRSYRTGEICGFSNDGGELATDFPRIMELLRRRPLAERFDVPDLDLYDVTVERIIAEIHERYVVRGEEFVPPPLDESQLPEWVWAAARPALYDQEARAPALVREDEIEYTSDDLES